ncbi:MAG: CvpA family protein [Ruminococcaceae bacterium]|nr:CvpA family protein [Oscillospiraceae bacterium]
MQFVWDIIIIAILAVCIWLSYKKGLIKTLFDLLGTVIAFLGALAFNGVVGNWIDTTFVRTPVRNMVLSTLADTPVLKYEDALAGIDVAAKIRKMPEALKSLLESVGVSTEEIIGKVSSVTANTAEAKNQLIDSIAAPISATISTAIAFILLFVVLLVVCMVASKLLSALFNLLPVGRQLNRFGGAAFGFVEGVLIVLVVTAVIWAVSRSAGDGLFSVDALDKTIFTKEIIKINPICDLFR